MNDQNQQDNNPELDPEIEQFMRDLSDGVELNFPDVLYGIPEDLLQYLKFKNGDIDPFEFSRNPIRALLNDKKANELFTVEGITYLARVYSFLYRSEQVRTRLLEEAPIGRLIAAMVTLANTYSIDRIAQTFFNAPEVEGNPIMQMAGLAMGRQLAQWASVASEQPAVELMMRNLVVVGYLMGRRADLASTLGVSDIPYGEDGGDFPDRVIYGVDDLGEAVSLDDLLDPTMTDMLRPNEGIQRDGE